MRLDKYVDSLDQPDKVIRLRVRALADSNANMVGKEFIIIDIEYTPDRDYWVSLKDYHEGGHFFC